MEMDLDVDGPIALESILFPTVDEVEEMDAHRDADVYMN